MTPAELLKHVRRLDTAGTVTATLEWALPAMQRNGWTTQKQHWIRWLGEYGSGGFWDRSNSDRDARYIYGHIQCPPMLLWLAEAVGVERARLTEAVARVLSVGRSSAKQAAAMRRIIPWSDVETMLNQRRDQ